jgi:DNA polymerase III subunit beta
MKVEIVQDKMQSAVARASRIAGRNTNLPVLSCILLVANKQGLLIRATNLELGIEILLPAKVTEEGTVAVPADVLNGLVGNLPAGRAVSLELKDGHLSVLSGKNKATVKAFPHEDFPTLPRPSDAAKFTTKASSFAEGLRSVWYCASSGSVKPELSSILVYVSGGSLVFAATDSFRLGEKKVSIRNIPEFDQILIPLRNSVELIKTFDAHPGEMTVEVGKHQLSFSLGDTYITSRLIEGSFPDYRQIIPKKTATEAVLLKQDLANTFKLANIFSDQFHQVKFSIDPAKRSFVLSSRNPDVGETSNALDATLSGEELEITFNYRYLADCFQSIPSDSVELRFSGLSKPLVIGGAADPSFLYLVMPMNR